MINKAVYLIMRGIWRFIKDFKPNIISIIALSTLIFVYHTLYSVGNGASAFLQHVAEIKSARAYLQPKADYGNILSKVANMNGVASSIYFSPADAKKYVEQNAPNMSGLKSFSEEFFPAFIEITPSNPKDQKLLDNIVEAVAKIPGVESVSYGKDVMEKFLNVSRGATFFIFILSILFIISASFVIYNTVKLSLYKFREEIKLYSLVGATKSFISVPFTVSSLLTAFIAFGTGTFLFYFGLKFFNGKILYPAGLNLMETPTSTYFLYVLVFIAILSVVAALSSVKSFMKRVASINEK